MRRALWPGDEYLLSKVGEDNDRQRQGGRCPARTRRREERQGECFDRTGSIDESVGFHPVTGVTRAREPGRILVLVPWPHGVKRLREPALQVGGRLGTASARSSPARLALMPCAEGA